ncbi:hypothetical protein P7C73_g4067, partial [Tremellales sp. Uapishka_1]
MSPPSATVAQHRHRSKRAAPFILMIICIFTMGTLALDRDLDRHPQLMSASMRPYLDTRRDRFGIIVHRDQTPSATPTSTFALVPTSTFTSTSTPTSTRTVFQDATPANEPSAEETGSSDTMEKR